jgi:hypothetical protein
MSPIWFEAATREKGEGKREGKGTQDVFGWVVANRSWISYFD